MSIENFTDQAKWKFWMALALTLKLSVDRITISQVLETTAVRRASSQSIFIQASINYGDVSTAFDLTMKLTQISLNANLATQGLPMGTIESVTFSDIRQAGNLTPNASVVSLDSEVLKSDSHYDVKTSKFPTTDVFQESAYEVSTSKISIMDSKLSEKTLVNEQASLQADASTTVYYNHTERPSLNNDTSAQILANQPSDSEKGNLNKILIGVLVGAISFVILICLLYTKRKDIQILLSNLMPIHFSKRRITR